MVTAKNRRLRLALDRLRRGPEEAPERLSHGELVERLLRSTVARQTELRDALRREYRYEYARFVLDLLHRLVDPEEESGELHGLAKPKSESGELQMADLFQADWLESPLVQVVTARLQDLLRPGLPAPGDEPLQCRALMTAELAKQGMAVPPAESAQCFSHLSVSHEQGEPCPNLRRLPPRQLT